MIIRPLCLQYIVTPMPPTVITITGFIMFYFPVDYEAPENHTLRLAPGLTEQLPMRLWF